MPRGRAPRDALPRGLPIRRCVAALSFCRWRSGPAGPVWTASRGFQTFPPAPPNEEV